MEKLSDILKREKVRLEGVLNEQNSVVDQTETTLADAKATRDGTIAELAKIDIFLEKETELDTLFAE